MKRVAHLALTLSIASLTYAQTREPLFGRVVNADDKPLAGATVTLVEDDLDLVGGFQFMGEMSLEDSTGVELAKEDVEAAPFVGVFASWRF